MRRWGVCGFVSIMASATLCLGEGTKMEPFRPPAIPLVTVDPYTSVWSLSDHLYDSWPAHWTGATHAMAGMMRVDGAARRFMGPDAVCPQAAQQKSVTVRPTQTVYVFEAGGVELTLTFLTPMLPDDLKVLTCPVTFVTFDARSLDGKPHEVAIYFDATAEWAVNKTSQPVVWKRSSDEAPGLTLLRFGTEGQPILQKSGDDLRLDWGYFYVGLPKLPGNESVIAERDEVRARFRDHGRIPRRDDKKMPRPAEDHWPVIACLMPLGVVAAEPVSKSLVLAYDDIYSIEYMQKPLRPWWFGQYGSFGAMLQACFNAYDDLRKRCGALDAELAADATRLGGEAYARLIALSYRHVWASGKTVAGPDGAPWFFTKECFSNGCTGTVDVAYPASPFFALFSPALLKGMMTMVFDFAASGDWQFPFAPHDVGRYPKANGQVYNRGKLEGQMPVEECGNMLLMAAEAAKADGNPDYAATHWKLLTQWAEYLKEKGLDPENQLCTDDFTGHLAHNANLSLKAINALGAYAMLCDMQGKSSDAASYKQAARDMAAKWVKMAADTAPPAHSMLTFDRPDSWSMKYNLVWDKLLGLGLFPPDVARTEVAYCLTRQNAYGLPLDCRADFTKSDWLVWCATLAESQGDFEKFVAPLYRFCQETPDRVPFTDWYDTKTAKCVGFRARPVIGGVFIKFLADEQVWAKWRNRAGK